MGPAYHKGVPCPWGSLEFPSRLVLLKNKVDECREDHICAEARVEQKLEKLWICGGFFVVSKWEGFSTTSRINNMTMEKQPGMKMYLLLKMGGFSSLPC